MKADMLVWKSYHKKIPKAVKNCGTITRQKHRTSTSSWSNDDTSKENLHFDDQSKHKLFSVLLCFYNSIRTQLEWEVDVMMAQAKGI